MSGVLWGVIILCFILSFIGVIFPLLPSVLAIWAGFLVYHFFLDAPGLGRFFWISMLLLTGILIFADIIANSYFVRKLDGSLWGERSAAIAVIVGSFIYPPFGILLLPPLVVYLVERAQKKSNQAAIRASIGSFIGFLSGTLAKIILQFIMIIWFFITLIIAY